MDLNDIPSLKLLYLRATVVESKVVYFVKKSACRGEIFYRSIEKVILYGECGGNPVSYLRRLSNDILPCVVNSKVILRNLFCA